jgi:methylamine--corrinoid protein Co-methyltransferase
MANFLDVYERALIGPVMSEKEFDMKVFIPQIRKVVKEFGIKYDRENPVPSDNAMADKVFNAAVEFMSRVGVYCVDTNRVMEFSEKEVVQAIKDGPRTCRVGEGKDARLYEMRKPDDPKRPWFLLGSGIVSSREEYATNIVEGLASIPEADSLNIPALDSIRGLKVKAGTPLEFYATLRGLRIALEALKRAGRPGLAIVNHHPTPAVAVTNIAASAPQFGCRPTDAWLCGTIAEMKVSHDTLNKVAYLKAWGANVAAEAGPMLGGYSGGPEGFAVLCTACILMGQLVHQGDYHHNFPFHFQHITSGTRDVLWGVSTAIQASSRNISIPTLWANYCAAGPNTKMYFYEAAAIILAWTTSGAPGVMMPHPARAVKIDGLTPMEAKFTTEMGIAAAKLDRATANDLVIRLLEKYESRIGEAPSGSRYQDCYDASTGKPGDDYLKLYDEVKEELAGMGVPFEK